MFLYLSMLQFLKDLKSWWHQQTSFVCSLVFSLMQTMTQIQLPFLVGLSIPVKMGNKRSVCTLFIKTIPKFYFIYYRVISFPEFQAFEGLLCLDLSRSTLPYCISAFWHQWFRLSFIWLVLKISSILNYNFIHVFIYFQKTLKM